MQAIVHIGAPKTGSSTIQQFLWINAAALANQGFHYERFQPEEKSQFEFPMAALARMGQMLPNRDEQLRYGAADLDTQRALGETVIARLTTAAGTWQEHTAIFSSEHIRPWLSSVEAVRVFDDMFRSIFDEVRYILYIRNQEDLILSLYSQDVKNGGSARLGAFFQKILRYMDLESGVMRWVEAVGRDRFDLRLFDPTFLPQGDVLQDFALACGIDSQGLSVPPQVNESLDAASAEILRVLNSRIPHLLAQGGFNPLSIGQVGRVVGAAGPGPRLALTPEQRETLGQHFGAGNERLRARFFPDREDLFSQVRSADLPQRPKVLEQALGIAADLIIQLRMGQWPPLSQDQRQTAIFRDPIDNGPTVATATPGHPTQDATGASPQPISPQPSPLQTVQPLPSGSLAARKSS